MVKPIKSTVSLTANVTATTGSIANATLIKHVIVELLELNASRKLSQHAKSNVTPTELARLAKPNG